MSHRCWYVFHLFQVQCDRCDWWLHYECSASALEIEELRASPTPYVCPLCRVSDVIVTDERFVLKKRTVRHKVCRGCRGKFKDGSSEKSDYLLRRKEIYSYFNPKEKVTKQTFGNRFYHVNLKCVKTNWPDNVGNELIVLSSVKSGLTDVNKNHFLKSGIIVD
jgi:hypothetical protein